ncbi:hypothetical protein SAMN04489764_0001, partial [Thermostaphylospora chromogena]
MRCSSSIAATAEAAGLSIPLDVAVLLIAVVTGA